MGNQIIMTIEDSIEWYLSKRDSYKRLAGKVHNITEELLILNNIDFHAIFSRAKEIDSFKEKIQDPKYKNPQEEITDLAGIRIICYVESDILKIRKIIEDNFDIDLPNSGDKSDLLGTDKVGYKSVHYVAKLNKDRLALPEYKIFENTKFEIQIRTILQHAWAEIEHDRNYKFSGELPPEIQRRFKLVAGSLELADKEFDRIAADIDAINLEVEKSTKEGKVNFEINSTTLKQFLNTKFESLIPIILDPNFPSGDAKIIKELKDFGLLTLNDLNKIIPQDFISQLKKHSSEKTTFTGVLRHLMIINDWEKYFEKAHNKGWNTRNLKDRSILHHYKTPFKEIEEKLKT